MKHRISLTTALLLAVVASSLTAQYPTAPPSPTALRPLEFPTVSETTLDNGMRIVVVENHSLPIVSVSLNVAAGTRYDPDGLTGLAIAAAELITKGTESRSADQIAELIESAGGSLTANPGNDFFVLSSTVLTDKVELLFELMGDVVLHSTFPESELELFRTRMLSTIRANKTVPSALVSQYFAREIYGDHPYGRTAHEASISAISRDDVVAFARDRLVPGGALLVVAGDISASRVRSLARRALGEWSGEAKTLDVPAPPERRATEILLVHRPGSAQSTIWIGNLALRSSDNLYYAARITNQVLGGGFEGRLLKILREEKGWTYSSGSGLVRRKDIGYFRAGAEVRTEVTDSTIVELLHQLRLIRQDDLTEDELSSAKDFMVGSFPLAIETPQQIAGAVANVKLLGLGDEYLSTYRERLSRVTASDAKKAARAIIHPDSAVLVVVGDGQAIYEKLAAVAPVNIIDTDGNPVSPEDLAPKAIAVEFDASQLEAGTDSFQITVQGNPMGRLVTELSKSGDTLVYTETMSLAAVGISQATTLRFDATTLATLTVEQNGQFGGQASEIQLTYSDGRVAGHTQTPQPGGAPKVVDIDTTVVSGTIDLNAVQFLLPTLPLAEGASWTLNAFDASTGAMRQVKLKVAGVEDVTVPAGTFSTFRIDGDTGGQSFVFYVSREAPRRLIKVELVGQPLGFELVSRR